VEGKDEFLKRRHRKRGPRTYRCNGEGPGARSRGAAFPTNGHMSGTRQTGLAVPIYAWIIIGPDQAPVAERQLRFPPATVRRSVMSASPEFRAYAQECLRWAEESSDEGQRQALLDLAKQWTQAALEADRSSLLVDGSPPLVPEKR
jgi:hypothetical protein